MIVPDPCEAFPRVCEDRYINVCTFRTPDTPSPACRARIRRMSKHSGILSLSADFELSTAPLQAVMRTLHQPTLLIWGREDRLVPWDHACILEARMPRSRTLLFEECGHLPQLEQPR